jgi:hypothetical protein
MDTNLDDLLLWQLVVTSLPLIPPPPSLTPKDSVEVDSSEG